MENNYIVTTPSDNDTHGFETLVWADLHSADFVFNKPFCLRLSDNQYIICEKVVRVMPKRRIVAFGTWQGKQIVAKLFFDAKNAKKHLEKDVAGVKSLHKNKIPTPELLYEGKSADGRVYVLIFELIMNAGNLEDIWRSKRDINEVMPLLKSVIVEIATQHVLGLLQHDLHLRNFLLTEKKIYTPAIPIDDKKHEPELADDISSDPVSDATHAAATGIKVYTLDGAQIQEFPNMLTKKVSMHNLALFLSQLGINVEATQEILFKYYAEARGWSLKPEDFIELFVLIKRWNDVRWKRFAKKVFRNSSHFASANTYTSKVMYNRHFATPEVAAIIANPELAFSHKTSRLLKAGRSATVVKLTLDGRDYVVKRYNIKNVFHWLRRCLRPSRAHSSWRLAQKLFLFNIPTALPIAFIERNFFGFRGTSYYITDYVSGDHAGEFFYRNFTKAEKISGMIKRISVLLKSVAKVEITHGDLKITNILIDENEQPVLIDLDGAAEHMSLSSLRKAWKKELQRFLENFRSNPVVLQKFEAELQKW